ncbi:EthD family reductase [Aridibaculum aurantiacum]|uniref:EthD family reductase n=1 Tax=Aridibaculum aurantiacum TaxID=2810307 RepID=UPI001A9754BC|nr:EthD family reductase [Aridibaculum aurantiacum]
MHKITVLYNHPGDEAAFEDYYENKHLPMARHMPGVSKVELTKFVPTPGGDQPEFYRMAELYFSSEEQMIETMGSPEGQAVIDDIHNLSEAGVKVVIGKVTTY